MGAASSPEILPFPAEPEPEPEHAAGLVSNVRVNLYQAKTGRNLLAEVSFVLMGLIKIHHARLHHDALGRVRLSFPSRTAGAECPACHRRVGTTERHCHFCGARQPWREVREGKLYRELVHPIDNAVRARIEREVLAEYLRAIGVRPRGIGGGS